MKYNWGMPLEKLSWVTCMYMLLNSPDSAYLSARDLYRAFIKVNPDFWEN